MTIPGLTGRDHIVLGTYGPGPLQLPVSLPLHEMLTHLWCIGVSGAGKSRWLAGLILMLMNRGQSVTLIDPHGDLARLTLAHLVDKGVFDDAQAFERIVYLDLPGAARQQRYLPLNVLAQPYDRHTVAQNVLEALRRAWPQLGDGAAPNFENIVLAGTYVLIANQLPLPLLHDVLVEKEWRDQLLLNVDDEAVTGFFRERYDRWARDQAGLIESTLRRVFLLGFSPALRNSWLQPELMLNQRATIDQNRTVLINLALPDGDARKLLGCMLTVMTEQAALSRADLPPGARFGNHFMIIDEFAEFTSQSSEAFARILSMCRKYGLYLGLAHQTFSQASERLLGALQNAGLSVSFRLGRSDAERAAPIFAKVNPLAVKHEVEDMKALGRTHPVFYSNPEQFEVFTQKLQNLPPRHAYLRKPNGQVIQLRSLAVPDPPIDPERLAEIEEQYLMRYFRAEQDIRRITAGYRERVEPAPTTTRYQPLGER